MKRALVAGGAGFIGSHLVDSLVADGYDVAVLDDLSTGRLKNLSHCDNVRFFLHDVGVEILDEGYEFRNPSLGDWLESSDTIDYVFNLACPASPPFYQHTPIRTMLTNVVGTKNMVDLAATFRSKFFQASTSEVYGDPTYEHRLQREDYRGNVNCFGPRACYDEGKRAAEALCYDYYKKLRVPVKVARIFNTYGPRMRPDDGRVVTNFITQALADQPMTLFGGGSQTRSLCYVSDLIRGIRMLMETPDDFTGPVNLGNPNEISVNVLGDIVHRLLGKAPRYVNLPLRQDDPYQRCPDIGLAEAALGWCPEVGLDKGLQQTISSLQQELENPADE